MFCEAKKNKVHAKLPPAAGIGKVCGWAQRSKHCRDVQSDRAGGRDNRFVTDCTLLRPAFCLTLCHPPSFSPSVSLPPSLCPCLPLSIYLPAVESVPQVKAKMQEMWRNLNEEDRDRFERTALWQNESLRIQQQATSTVGSSRSNVGKVWQKLEGREGGREYPWLGCLLFCARGFFTKTTHI